jgi:hypothetical protein
MLPAGMQGAVRRAHEIEMAALIDEWQVTGCTAKAFARTRGVSVSTLKRWRRRLAAATSEGPGRSPRGGTLVPVRVVAPREEGEAALEVVLTTGDRIRLGRGVTPELLRALVEALRTGC